MTTNKLVAPMLAVFAGSVSVMVAEATLGGSVKAAVHGERPRLVFVSPAPVEAGFVGGLTGADLVCRESAQASGLAGIFLAWLGDGMLGPANRFERREGPLVNVRGEQVAAGWRELGDGGRGARPLRLDGTVPETAPWTNVGPDGRSGIAATACNRWWSTGREHAGAVGIGSGAGAQVSSCAAPRPFVCVEQ